MQSHYYTVNVSWNTDRRGMLCSPELKPNASGDGCIEVATPPQFPKGIEGIWSPEHLFTAAVASCFMTTFLAIAENSKLDFSAFHCSSRGKLDQVDNKPVMTEVELFPTVVLRNQDDRQRAQRILEKTEAACLITNSIKAKVTMQATIETEPRDEVTRKAVSTGML